MENVKNITENNEAQEAQEVQEQAQEVAVVTESDTKDGVYTHVLAKPFEHCGITHKKFDFDFEKLKGSDMVAIENEMAAVGEYALSPEISTSFLARMAARAAGVGSDVILALPLKEFGKIKNESRNFLIGTGF